jgi:predicted nucleotidyltransferase
MLEIFERKRIEEVKGGDIDILIISNEKLSFMDICQMRIHFYKMFGEQKVDVITQRDIERIKNSLI